MSHGFQCRFHFTSRDLCPRRLLCRTPRPQGPRRGCCTHSSTEEPCGRRRAKARWTRVRKKDTSAIAVPFHRSPAPRLGGFEIASGGRGGLAYIRRLTRIHAHRTTHRARFAGPGKTTPLGQPQRHTCWVRGLETVVSPFPHHAALELGIGIECCNVFCQISRPVAPSSVHIHRGSGACPLRARLLVESIRPDRGTLVTKCRCTWLDGRLRSGWAGCHRGSEACWSWLVCCSRRSFRSIREHGITK